MNGKPGTLAAALLAGAVTMASTAHAQVPEDRWTYQAIVYGYFPDIGGSTRFPERSGGSNIDVDIGKILSNLNFTFMGTMEARKGRWGLFTDLIYLDVSGDQNGSRDFRVGGQGIPASLSSNLDVGIKGTLWTIAGEYLAVNAPSTTLYVVGGARLLDVKESLSYSLSADFGPFVGPGRSGGTDVKQSYWDAVVGVKGRYDFGAQREWFVPFYADVGTGQSDLTYTLFAGLGYQFRWGSILGGWRYIDYKFKSGSNIEGLDFNGPMVGVGFNW
jgi:hypothetical protein